MERPWPWMVTMLCLARAAGAEGPAAPRARSSPDWVKDAVVYEVFPRAFSPAGNLAGIEARLGDLQDLGITVLWLMPIHPVGRERAKGSFGSPYAVRDYDAIHPAYGTKDDLRRLTAAAHARGMRVILDVVLNHTSWDAVLMKEHPEYYTRDAAGRIVPPVADWADVADLDYAQPGLRRAQIASLKRWVEETGVDGFRCDVAGMVPTDFWEQARAELQKVKPDLLMLAEADAPDLVREAFDLLYAWPLHHALDAVMQGSRPASWLRTTWEQDRARLPPGALQLRFSDNHDERRAIARFGEKGALAASALMFTLDGVPLLYNGMEAGDTTESGWPALFEKVPVNWAFEARRPQFRPFYRQLAALRRDHPVLRGGEVVFVPNSDEDRVLSYVRRAAGGEVLVVLNLSSRPFRGTVEAAGAFTDVTPEVMPRAALALPALSLDAWGFRILARVR